MRYPFKHLEGVRPPKPIAAFDTETNDLGGELLLITATLGPGQEYEFRPHQISEFLNLVSKSHHIWYAHNLGYDLRRLLGPMLDYFGDSLKITMRSEADVLKISALGQKWEMRDSLAIFPHSLKRFSASFAPEFPKLDIGPDISAFDPTNSVHMAYARRDADSLFRAVSNFSEKVSELYGVYPRATLTSTAFAAWRHGLDDEVFWPPRMGDVIDRVSRAAYYGALTGLTTDDSERNVFYYDINSSYPSTMRRFGVPTGTPFSQHSFAKAMLVPSLCIVEVETPKDLIIPILPARDRGGRTVWRRGTFKTIVWSDELAFAFDHGYKLVNFDEAISWREVIHPFGDFVDSSEDMRTKFRGTELETIVKLMQNGLYGRFGMRHDRLEVFVNPSWQDMVEKHGLMSKWDERLWLAHVTSEVAAMPHWASWVTAHARLSLLDYIYGHAGVENVIYYDTDSLVTRVPLFADVAPYYGKLKLVEECSYFRARAPKVYLSQGPIAGTQLAAKGLKMDDEARQAVAEAIRQDGPATVEFRSLSSFGSVLTRGPTRARPVIRDLSNIEHSSNFERADGLVRPKLSVAGE